MNPSDGLKYVSELVDKHRAEIATKDATIARLEAENKRMQDALESLRYIHDGNPSDALADIEPVDYARHMLGEARAIARETLREIEEIRAIPDPAGGMPVEVK